MQIRTEKSLGKLYPDLVKEWHPTKNGKLTPYDVTPGSGKKVWWKFDQDHEWKVIISSRTRGNGCPYCAREKRRLNI